MLKANSGFKVAFYHREGVSVADRIAEEALSFENYVPKLYSVTPRWLKDFVEADMPIENT